MECRIDYIAIGPVFATSSKENLDPVVGLDGVRRVRAELGDDISLVAIGGITAANAIGVLQAGANAVSVINALIANSTQISQRTRDLLTRL
jgi:thiamine-phosphate pyrophosphorylase